MSREPIRMADLTDGASSEEEFMRAVIRAERTELPTDAKMQELSARLNPIVAKRTSFAPLAAPWRWLLVAGLVAGLTGVISLRAGSGTPSLPGAAPESPALASEPPVAPPRPALSVEPPVAPPPGPTPPVVAVESLPSVTPPARARAASASPASDCADEIELLDRADAALRAGDAARALALTREHSERCAAGAFVQERERIAIDALSRLGRHDEMRARARSFEARFPSSPHLQRVRSLVEQHAE